MRQEITDETLAKIYKLSKLSGEEMDREKQKSELEHIITFFHQLAEVDTTGTDPLSYPFHTEMSQRPDVVRDMDGSNETLRNAKQVRERMIVVPRSTGE